MQSELSRLSLPTLRTLHTLTVLRSGGSPRPLGRPDLVRGIISAASSTTMPAAAAEDEEEGWFLVDGTPLLSPASTPPAISTASHSPFTSLASAAGSGADWVAPRWAPAQARESLTPRSPLQVVASTSSTGEVGQWAPPSWAPSSPATANEDELHILQNQQQHVKDVVGIQGVDWEWTPPRWTTADAGQHHTPELNAGETESHFPPSFGITDNRPPQPTRQIIHLTSSSEWSPPSWSPPHFFASNRHSTPMPVAPASALETTMQDVIKAAKEWTPPVWVINALERMSEKDDPGAEGSRHGPGHGHGMMMV